MTRSPDSRSLTGQHIFDHIRWDVEQEAWIAENGRVHSTRRWRANQPVEGLYEIRSATPRGEGHLDLSKRST